MDVCPDDGVVKMLACLRVPNHNCLLLVRYAYDFDVGQSMTLGLEVLACFFFAFFDNRAQFGGAMLMPSEQFF